MIRHPLPSISYQSPVTGRRSARSEAAIAVFCALVVALGLMAPRCVFAQPGEGVKAGKWVIHPIGRVQEQYDSNIFLEPTAEKGDWISTFAGGFEVKGVVSAYTEISAGYLAEYNLFGEYYKQSALNQYARAALQHQFKDITLTVDDSFQHLYSRPDTETTERVLWNKNDLGAKLSAEYNRFGWSAEYRNIYYNYQTDGWDGENRWENDANLVFSYRVATKTYVFTEVNYGNIAYVEKVNSDANFIQSLVGVRGKLFAKLTGTAKAGYQYRHYIRETMKDYSGFVTIAGLIEEFTARDTLTIDWIRTPYESLYTGTNYYVDNSIAMKYTHDFTQKFSGIVKGLYRLSEYPTETLDGGTWKKRLDNTWSLGGGIEYRVKKWLVCNAGYDFIQRKSNFGDLDYNDNLATISAKAAY